MANLTYLKEIVTPRRGQEGAGKNRGNKNRISY